ncbi:MAG: hypothetical protein A2942_04410 [Candidatus Lloydbacteria bacterium RIFCSPLOWO2_01_FULL_50_20]|uniref:Uncharacterized protein n=1 Tax=Candidatus Lloydbacteria bacterium RIFCSPLOWO2_01_FULL_50_20 TaxID=1798665 RepID=A0A1G2DET2_9BACT|nr:MAG: hypothetical protein A3C13_03005 [Candidatus Lloydbacteria bacterium RIFCSPHIGHO2_02_FULL_50_11]OGZ11461.1 MAG: hypothetical protein A2942_04410 [Candidatus Lloydbacteria bacterium RIFCSPLOWO2_01_FULL_50_20]
MGMFSEFASAGTVAAIVAEIEKELKVNKDKPEVCVILRKLGRFSLTLFEWSAPDWARKYERLFKERK